MSVLGAEEASLMGSENKKCTKSHILMKKAGFFLLFFLLSVSLASATVEDNFNRANGNLIGSTATNGNTWTSVTATGTNVALQVAQNNYLVNTSGTSGSNGNQEHYLESDTDSQKTRIDLWNITITSVANIEEYIKFYDLGAGTEFSRMRIHTSGSGQLEYYDGSTYVGTGFTPSNNVPFSISIRDIDWVGHTYDIYVNDVLKIDDGTFYNAVDSFGKLQLLYQLDIGVDRQDFELFCFTTDQTTAAGCFPSGPGPGPVAGNTTFTAASYTNASLTYNVTFGNGSVYYEYLNKQGTITTPILDNDTSLWTFNVSADYHFNRTLYNKDVTGGWIGTNLSEYPTLNVTNQYNHSKYINSFNSTIGSNTYITTTGAIRVPYNESVSVTTRAERYFSNATTIDFTGPTDRTTSLYPYTVITAYFANSTPLQVSTYTLNITINGSDETHYVSNGTLQLPIYNEIVNMTIWNASVYGIELQTQTVVINSTNSYLRSQTFYLYTANSFFFTIRNETTNLPVSQTAVLQLIGASFSAQYNATGTLNLTLLTPQEYTIRYWIDPNVPREYYVTLINGSIENITLYTIDDADSDLYYPVVTNENGVPCPGNKISLMRYYIDINGYRVVEMAKTDTNGQGVLFVQPQITNYKLLFDGSCGTFTTEPQKITDSTDRFTVTNAQALLTSSEAINNAAIAFTFNNATNTYNFVWNDPTNTVAQACIYVYKHEYFTQELNYTACSNTASGSLIYTLVGNLTETQWSAQAVLHTNTDYSDYTFRGPDIDMSSAAGLGIAALFWLAIAILAFVVAFGNDASTIIVSTIGLIAVFATMGFIAGGGSMVIGLVIVGVVMLYKLKRVY